MIRPLIKHEKENIMTDKKIEISTELVVDVAPGVVLSNNFSEFNTYWRGVMSAADIQPKTGDDVAKINEFKKQSDAVEKKVADALRLAMTGNPEIQKLVSELEELRGDSRSLRLKLGKLAASWLTDQKQAEVQKHVERVAVESGILFTGRISKAGRKFCEIVPRLEGAGKGKKTLDTYASAVSAEADLIISEMKQVAETCNANLAAIDATELPASFQDSEALMILPEDQLAAEIGRRAAEYNLQETKKKAQVRRNPEKLGELKEKVSTIENVIHLERWWKSHEDEIKEALPHSGDIEELLKHCGGRKVELNIKLQESRNVPPIHEDKHPESGPSHAQPAGVKQDEQAAKEELQAKQPDTAPTNTQEAMKEQVPPEDLSFTFRVTIPGNSQASKDKANALAKDIWKMVGSRGCVAEEIKD